MGKFLRNGRAQSAIETLIILAVALFILTALVAIVYNQLNASYLQEQQKLAVNALSTLAKEVDDTYFLGPGTVKSVLINFPEAVDLERSYISGKTLVLNVGNSDLFQTTKVDVRGVWPNEDGSFIFTITAFNDFVLVSAQKVNVSPVQVIESVSQGSSEDVNVFVFNNTDETIAYFVDVNFPFSGTGSTISSSESDISINPGESSQVTITITCSRNSFGSYSGLLTFAAQDAEDSNISVPLNVVCTSAQTKLSIYPSTKNIYSYPGQSFNESVLVCNNSSVNFSYSKSSVVGTVSNYVLTTFSEAIPASSCKTALLKFNAPAVEGSYAGLFNVESSGFNATADLNLIVSSTSNTLDINWNNAYLATDSNKIVDANIINGGGFVIVQEVMVLFTNDIDDANVTNFYIRGVDKAPVSTKAGSGQWINVTDFNLESQKNYTLNILFDANIKNDSEKFRVLFKLNNGQYIWSSIFDPTSTAIDFLQKHFSDSNIGREPIYPRNSNLVGLWRFNGNANDSKGSNHGLLNGTIQTSGLWDTNAYYFDGSDDFVRTSLTTAFTNFTICAWFYSSGLGGAYDRIADKLYTTGFWLGRNSSTSNSWGGGILESSNPYGHYITLQDGQWHHICMMRDGTTKTIIGDGSVTNSGTVSASALNSSPIYFGVRQDNNQNDFYGKIDEVAIWNTALTAEEVREIYFMGVGKYDSNVQGTSTGITLSGSVGSYLGDGNFYSRVFDLNGSANLNSFSWASSSAGTGASSSIKYDSNVLLADYNYTSFSERIPDKNYWTATNALDWNLAIYGSQLGFTGYNQLSLSGVPFSPASSLWDSNLVAMWHLDSNFEDVVGPADGYTSGVVYKKGFYDNNGIYCDGATNYNFTNSSSHLNVSKFTFNAWVKSDTNSGGGRGFYTHGGGNGYSAGFRVFVDPTNQRAYMNWGSGSAFDGILYSSIGSVPNFGWSMVSATYDGSAMRIYVNGVLENIDTSVLYGYATSSYGSFCRCAGCVVFLGSVEETAFWNRPLSETELKQLYTLQAGKFHETNLIGLWHLNNDANDSSYARNHGSPKNFASDTNVSGLWDTNGYFLDGLNDYIHVADNNEFDYNGGDLTLSTWFRPAVDENGTGYIFSKPWNSAGVYNYRLVYDRNYKLSFVLEGASSTSLSTDNNVLIAGRWNHIVVVLNNTKHIHIYVNGKLLKHTTHSITNWTPGIAHVQLALAIGTLYPYGAGWAGNTEFSARGLFEEVGIWTKALTQTEVGELYRTQALDVLDENLVGLWRLNGDYNDYSGAGNHLTCSSCPDATQGLWDTNAFDFERDNSDNIYKTSGVSWDITGAQTKSFSFGMWVKPESCTNYYENSFSASAGRFRVGVYNGGWYFQLAPSTNIASGGACVPGRWNHLAGTFNQDNNSLYLYYNGVYMSSANATAGADSSAISDGVMIGRGQDYFDGTIEDVALWTRVLSAAEIKALYDSYKGKQFDPFLVAQYRLDTNSATIVFDSARGLDGTLSTGAALNVAGMWDSNALNCGTTSNSYYVTVADRNELKINVNQTIRMWIRPRNYGAARQNPYAKAYGGEGTMTQEIGGTINYFYGTSGTNGGTYQAFNTVAVLKNNVWTHITVVRDLSKSTLSWYVNGVSTASVAASYPEAVVGTQPLYFAYGYAGNYDGYIDEVALWDRALSASEVLADYNSFLSSKFINTSSFSRDYNLARLLFKTNSLLRYNFGYEMESRADNTLLDVNQLESTSPLWDSNLVGLWHFNKSSIDSSGQNNNGTNIGFSGDKNVSCLWDTNCYEFDGSNAYVQVGDSTDLNGASEITISSWVYFYSLTDYDAILSSYDSTGTLYNFATLGVYTAGSRQFRADFGNGTQYTTVYSPALIDTNRWTHVAVTWKSGNNAKIYVNGVDSSYSYGGSVPNNMTGVLIIKDYFKAGFSDLGADRKLNGKLEELGLWNRALSASEVKNLYDSQAGSFSQINALAGVWHLNNNSSSVDLNDFSGNAGTGSCSNCPSLDVGLFDTNSAKFDGSNDIVTIPDSAALDLNRNLTISAWIYPTKSSGIQSVISKSSNSPNDGYIFPRTDDGWANIIAYLHIAGSFRTLSAKYPSRNEWHHTALTYDGATIKLFIDGLLAASTTAYSGNLTANSNSLTFGNQPGYSEYYGGFLEEPAIWNRTFSEQEILDLYRKGVSRLDVNIYSCNNSTCSSKRSSTYLSKVKNNYLHDTNLTNARYFGYEALFKPNDKNLFNSGYYQVNSFLKDINFFSDYTDRNISLRSSNTGIAWNDWNNIGRTPINVSITGAKYFQYKTNLLSYNPNVSPKISDVNIYYTRTGN